MAGSPVQEHFYLEPHSSVVIPGEGDELTAFSSTQCPDKHQKYIAHVLGIPMHKIVVRTKRLGEQQHSGGWVANIEHRYYAHLIANHWL